MANVVKQIPILRDMHRMSVVCVLDGSCSFAEHWQTVAIYISPLLSALAQQAVKSTNGLNISVQDLVSTCQIAIVVYGAESSSTSPLLSRLHFLPPQMAVRLLKDGYELGLGTSSISSSSGMACLEGLVTALELFEIVAISGETPFSKHIVHFTDNPPGKAARPGWNRLPTLDNLDWGSLPNEIEKRCIQFNAITTRPLPEFDSFHQILNLEPISLNLKVTQPAYYSILSSRPSYLPRIAMSPPKMTASQNIGQIRTAYAQFKARDDEMERMKLNLLKAQKEKPEVDYSQVQTLLANRIAQLEKMRPQMEQNKAILVKFGQLPSVQPATDVASILLGSKHVPTDDGQSQGMLTNTPRPDKPLEPMEQAPTQFSPEADAPQWSGKFLWQGVDPNSNVRREMCAFAEAKTVANNWYVYHLLYHSLHFESHWSLWPATLNLSPIKMSGGFEALEQALKTVNAGVACLKSAGNAIEGKSGSENNFETLRTLLSSKVVGATCVLNKGECELLALVIFPSQGDAQGQLLAAVLPHQKVTMLSGRLHQAQTSTTHVQRSQPTQQMAIAQQVVQPQRQLQAQLPGVGHTMSNTPFGHGSRTGMTPEILQVMLRKSQDTVMKPS